jgi:DNA-binding transcriptional ArsR family regulator
VRRQTVLRGKGAAFGDQETIGDVSQHLKVLKEAGLITERRNGTQRLYAANPQAAFIGKKAIAKARAAK